MSVKELSEICDLACLSVDQKLIGRESYVYSTCTVHKRIKETAFPSRATIPKTRLGALPAAFMKHQPFAKEYSLALCQLPQDEEYNGMSLKAMREDLLAGPVNMNVEYKVTGAPHVSLHWISEGKKDESNDIIKGLIGEGLLMVDRKGGRRMAKMLGSYTEAMEEAKKGHLNIWEYGDITEDDAREFGPPPSRK